jgi:hypothetical protein
LIELKGVRAVKIGQGVSKLGKSLVVAFAHAHHRQRPPVARHITVQPRGQLQRLSPRLREGYDSMAVEIKTMAMSLTNSPSGTNTNKASKVRK